MLGVGYLDAASPPNQPVAVLFVRLRESGSAAQDVVVRLDSGKLRLLQVDGEPYVLRSGGGATYYCAALLIVRDRRRAMAMASTAALW